MTIKVAVVTAVSPTVRDSIQLKWKLMGCSFEQPFLYGDFSMPVPADIRAVPGRRNTIVDDSGRDGPKRYPQKPASFVRPPVSPHLVKKDLKFLDFIISN